MLKTKVTNEKDPEKRRKYEIELRRCESWSEKGDDFTECVGESLEDAEKVRMKDIETAGGVCARVLGYVDRRGTLKET